MYNGVAKAHTEGTACNDVSSCCAPGVSNNSGAEERQGAEERRKNKTKYDGGGGVCVSIRFVRAPTMLLSACASLHHAFTRFQWPNERR